MLAYVAALPRHIFHCEKEKLHRNLHQLQAHVPGLTFSPLSRTLSESYAQVKDGRGRFHRYTHPQARTARVATLASLSQSQGQPGPSKTCTLGWPEPLKPVHLFFTLTSSSTWSLKLKDGRSRSPLLRTGSIMTAGAAQNLFTHTHSKDGQTPSPLH